MNNYYTPSGTPAFLARALSSQQRSEDSLVQSGFDKLPDPDELGGSSQNYAVDTGMPSALVVALNPNITTAFDGMELVIKARYAATGPSTVTAGALALSSVLRMDGSPTQANDWLTGQIISMRYDSARGSYQYIPPYTGVAQVQVPLSDAAPIIKNSIDPTKQLQFNLSGISTGSTRIATVPDKNFTLGNDIIRVARNAGSNVSLAFANQFNWIDYTGGTFTQAFDACASLQSGWSVWLRNDGTGNITLDPSGAETIDGRTSFIMYPGEVRFVQCDGTALRSFVITPFLFISSGLGNFIKPPGYKEFLFTLDGGGSGGSGGSGGGSGSGISGNLTNGGGGGGGVSGNPGRRVTKVILADDLPNSVAFSVGAGGSAGAGGAAGAPSPSNATGNAGGVGTIGTAGGATSFGTVSDAYYLIASGGPVVATNASAGQPGAGGNGSAGTGGSDSTVAVTFSITFDQNQTIPTLAPASGSTGASGQAGSAGAGGAGGQARPSSAAITVAAAAAGGAQQNGFTAGNNGATGASGGVAQGGGGGGGGSGSRGVTPISPIAGAGGSGGTGGVGQFMVIGEV